MIVRCWRGRTTVDRADLYAQHLFGVVVPKLRALPGFAGVSLLRRADGGEIELTVQTSWESMEAIRRFAGATPEVAVVELAAQAMLTTYDAVVVHELVPDSDPVVESTKWVPAITSDLAE